MTQTTAERVTQANPIQEIISAMNDIQKLIANHDRNCTWGRLTEIALGQAYNALADALLTATNDLKYSLHRL